MLEKVSRLLPLLYYDMIPALFFNRNARIFSIDNERCSCATDPRTLVNISSWTPCKPCADNCESIKLFKTVRCSPLIETNFQSKYIGCLLQYPMNGDHPKIKKYKASTTKSCVDKCELSGKALALKVTQSEGCWCGDPQNA